MSSSQLGPACQLVVQYHEESEKFPVLTDCVQDDASHPNYILSCAEKGGLDCHGGPSHSSHKSVMLKRRIQLLKADIRTLKTIITCLNKDRQLFSRENFLSSSEELVHLRVKTILQYKTPNSDELHILMQDVIKQQLIDMSNDGFVKPRL